MKYGYVLAAPQVLCYANDNTASIDEHWVQSTLLFLQSNMVSSALVRRDFENMIQEHGDIVNVRRPNDFIVYNTDDASDVVTQDAISTKIQVPLDQWATVSFLIRDGERSKSFADLVTEYLEPAAIALAENVDRIVLGQVARLATYTAGKLGEMSATNAQSFLVEVNKVLNNNKAPKFNRNLILSTNAEAFLLQAGIVVEADKRGDEGTALREASIGRIYGMQTWMDQNVNSVDAADTDRLTGTVDSTAYAKGYTGAIDLVDASITATPVAGEFVVIEGDGHAHVLSAATLTADDITLVEALKNDVAAGATVHIYNSCAVDHPTAGTYAVGETGFIHVDGLASTKPLQVGQLLAVGTGGSRVVYTIVAVKDFSSGDQDIRLDRPLEGALADNAVLFPGPAGDINIAMVPDAVALVVRPLATPPAEEGVRSFVASFGGLSMRMTAQYDSLKQGTRVTMDMLLGVQILDERLAVRMYS